MIDIVFCLNSRGEVQDISVLMATLLASLAGEISVIIPLTEPLSPIVKDQYPDLGLLRRREQQRLGFPT